MYTRMVLGFQQAEGTVERKMDSILLGLCMQIPVYNVEEMTVCRIIIKLRANLKVLQVLENIGVYLN